MKTGLIRSSKSTACLCFKGPDRGIVDRLWPMNGLQAVFYRRPYGIVRKDNHVSGPFFNFSRRHCLRIESLAPPAARCGSEQLLPERTKARQRGQRIVSRGKRRPTRRTESKTGGGESISSAGDSGENRRNPYALLLSACGRGFDTYGQ